MDIILPAGVVGGGVLLVISWIWNQYLTSIENRIVSPPATVSCERSVVSTQHMSLAEAFFGSVQP
jgi:hypothetical protein